MLNDHLPAFAPYLICGLVGPALVVRFGNGGSIILIASMSGSITNRVIISLELPLTLPRARSIKLNAKLNIRDMTGLATTRVKAPCSRWHEVWRANWALRGFASIPFRQVRGIHFITPSFRCSRGRNCKKRPHSYKDDLGPSGHRARARYEMGK
jgi:hypothetical protein